MKHYIAPRTYIVIPCFNEQEVISETAKRLTKKISALIDLGKCSPESYIVFVDDGSVDSTWEIIEELYESNPHVLGIKSSRNRGHQNTLLAGLLTVKDRCDVAISMDADLQDDIEVLDEFLDKYSEGCEIVYGVRNSRKKDTLFKRGTAGLFYKMMNKLGVETVNNHADYRLMSKKALDALAEFKEVNLFLRGLVPLIGFKTGIVYYERNERFAGESKYPLKKMLHFAGDGITSLSIKPIRMITALGMLIFGISMIYLIYSLIRFITGNVVRGWTSIVISIWALGGLQIFAIGVIGEYIGKIYLETKHRPRYIIEEYLDEEGKR